MDHYLKPSRKRALSHHAYRRNLNHCLGKDAIPHSGHPGQSRASSDLPAAPIPEQICQDEKYRQPRAQVPAGITNS